MPTHNDHRPQAPTTPQALGLQRPNGWTLALLATWLIAFGSIIPATVSAQEAEAVDEPEGTEAETPTDEEAQAEEESDEGTEPADEDEEGSDESESRPVDTSLVGGLRWRGIGPALMSGRIVDIVIDPDKPSTWYIAAASGGVWKTTNAGTTWSPIFDGYGSYSIGCLAIDPEDRHVIWVGTGENNSQRSVGYGDGLYKSIDGGRSFKKVGLENSQHIGKILIDPRDSQVVYVASQGPLWNSGGDRGLYKTTDGGQTWTCVLEISPDTGVTDIVFDPRDPDVLYAASYQRRRRVWTLIDGGPEGAIYKSTDAGATWSKLRRGLPSGDVGRIGLAVSPINPDVVYAIIEAQGGASGFYRSADAGMSWTKRSSYISSSPQYYQEIIACPHVFDRVYSLDTYMHVTEDGGRTFDRLGERYKHVDNHALIIDPEDPEHLLIGCDGGLYETWDRGRNYRYFGNLPLTQFYKIAVDNSEPFYYVYGGTQDNATQGGPSETDNVHGIRNSDWFVTVFGDGFDPAVHPEDPNIVYSQWQYGGLVRYDRRTGQRIDIKPASEPDGPALRFNWDSALMISPHDPDRVYYGSQILFRSNDRGDTWTAVSPDLTRNLDRNTLKVMGRVWSVDTVAKNNSTSFYGTIVSLAESPLVEGLLYAGTDDGLVQISEDGGESWRKVERFEFTDAPEQAYIHDIECSLHEADTVYVAVNNHKDGDFKPYILKSVDRGRSWSLISGGLPERGSVYCLAVDHEDPDLLFAGTEFGVHVTLDGGRTWVALKSGMPTIAVRDLEIQRREDDLVAGSFGRGFFILDDYAPLRHLDSELLEQDAVMLPIAKASMYLRRAPMSGSEKAFQGSAFYNGANPPFGATMTYILKDGPTTKKSQRQRRERSLQKEGKDTPYPSWEDLKAEDREESTMTVLTIRDTEGEVVRRLSVPGSKGLHRITWDFRYPGLSTVSLGGDGYGPMALPGTYTAELERWSEGEMTTLIEPTSFEVEPLGYQELTTEERAEVLAFQKQTAALQRTARGALQVLSNAQEQIRYIKRAVMVAPELSPEIRLEARALELRLMDIAERFNGDPTRPRRSEPALPGLTHRIGQIVSGHWSTTSAPTATHLRAFEIAATQLEEALEELREAVEVDLPALNAKLDDAGVPWTPGRKLPRIDITEPIN